MILNKAIAQTEADYIIQVDGDCILHKKFISNHISRAREKVFLHGTRANIKKECVKTVLKKEILLFNFFSPMFIKCNNTLHIPILAQKYKPQSTSFPNAVKGCNVSFWRQDFIDINGCDESFEGWGHEERSLPE